MAPIYLPAVDSAGQPDPIAETRPESDPVIVPRVLWAPALTGQPLSDLDRVERFLACLAVEMMVPSKIGFSAARQFYCLETASTYCCSRDNRFLASPETTGAALAASILNVRSIPANGFHGRYS